MSQIGNTTYNLLKHIVRRCLRSVWENLYLNTVAAGVIGASLLLLGVYLSVIINLNSIVDTWNKDVHVSAYFESHVSPADRFALKDKIHQMPEATEVKYISEEDARNWLIDKVEGVEKSLEALGKDSLPASLEITLSTTAANPTAIAKFAEQIDTEEFEDVTYGVEWVDKFNAFLQLLTMLGTLLGTLILLSAMFLVTNTVHLVVYNRRNELEIAKLVGASQSFIIWPFLFEGAIQGLIGALSSITGLWIIHRTLTVRLQEALGLDMAGELKFLSIEHLLILTGVGLALGVLAAFIATKRFMSQAA